MAKTSYQLIPPELDLQYKKTMQSSNRFEFPRVRRKVLFMSRAKLKGLTEKSLLPTLSPVWNSLNAMEQSAWNNAGVECGLTGFKLFIKDTALRIKNGLSGYSTPSTIYQARVGKIHIEAPANKIKIGQLHPLTYWTQRKVRGTKAEYEPVQIVESFSLPLEIKISYNSNLTASGGTASAKFYCEVLSHYQGRNIITLVKIDFNIVQDWTRASATISNVLGLVRGYNAFIEIENSVGTVLYDNVELNHNGHNWARDSFCNDINQGFTKAFYQIPKHWVDIDVPEGAQFESSFHTVV